MLRKMTKQGPGAMGLCAMMSGAVAMFAGQAAAAPVTTTFTYQGVLEDGGAAATAQYDFQFLLFDAAAGGVQIGATNSRNNVNVADGVFTVELDFGQATDTEAWLEIRVRPGASAGLFTQLTPRQRVTTTPFSQFALDLRLPFERSVDLDGGFNDGVFDILNAGDRRIALFSKSSTTTGFHTMRLEGASPTVHPLGVYQSGAYFAGYFSSTGGDFTTTEIAGDGIGLTTDGDIEVTGVHGMRLDVETPSSAAGATLSFFEGATERGFLENNTSGMEFRSLSDTGGLRLYGDTDASANGGGFFSVARNDAGSTGFQVDGNDGTESTRVSILGAGASAAFDMTAAGDGSVSLPSGAINAAEMFDEPGAASATNGNFTTITGSTLQTILSRTINCPSSGYVLVIGTTQPLFTHTTGTTSQYNFGVSANATTLPSNQDVSFIVPSGASPGSYSSAHTVHGLFSVAAGNNTFYLLGQKIGSASPNCDAFDSQLTLIYIPTSYGTITSTLLAGDDGSEFNTARPFRASMGPAELAAERMQSIADNNARLQRELVQMQAQHQALLNEVRAIQAQQTGNRPAKTAPATPEFGGERERAAEPVASKD